MSRRKRAAEQANAQKSDLLAKISHEIRTPLNAIIGFAEVMLEERFGPVGNERYKEYLKDVHASGAHVISLVNDLLDLAKIEAGRMELSFTSVSLNELVGATVTLLQPQAARDRIVMRTSFAPKLPPVVADERSVRQIVLNLVSNAIKFTDAGGQVIVSTALTDRGEVAFRVRDTGIGMNDEEVEAALEPFRQLATARKRGGTGLGLPLTKALVEANRGALQISSSPNEGTLVEVLFPPTRVLARIARRDSLAACAVVRRTGGSMHFALTEEEEMIRDTARRIAADRLAPLAERLDAGEGREELLANLKELAENGFMALNVEAEYGGADSRHRRLRARRSRNSAMPARRPRVATSVTNMVGEVIQAVGSAEQKERHLPRLADGTYPAGAFCLTESGAGSDPSAMRTRARRDGDGYVIDGSKLYITSAEFAGALRRLGGDRSGGAEGQGHLLFPRRARHAGPRHRQGGEEDGPAGSPTNAVHFDGCRVAGETP